MLPFAADPLFAAVAAVTALVLVWNVTLAGQIAQLREAPRFFSTVTGLIGLLVIPALFVNIVGASLITGRSIGGVDWIWPAVLVLFVVQAAYATARRLVSSLLGVPILVYNAILATAAIVRLAEAHAWGLPVIASAFPAAEAAVLGLATGTPSLWSPLAVAMPLLSPAYPARWRVSKSVRVALALFAAGASALVALEGIRAVRAVTSYARYDGELLRERAPADFAIGLRLLPTLGGAPPSVALRHDLALADSAGVRVFHVVIDPQGARSLALDSLARAFEGRRSDSTLLVVSMGFGADDGERLRAAPAEFWATRLGDLERVVRRLRPDVLLPVEEPYGRAARLLGRRSPSDWAAYVRTAAARARRLRPRTRIGLAASSYEPADSALFTWAASPGSPVDIPGLLLRPSFGGGVALDARLRTADRWLRHAPGAKPVWVFAAGGFPSAHGERSQARAIWGTMAWASAHDRVKGVIIADAGDYDGRTGLRAADGHLRPAALVLTRAMRSLREVVAP